MYFNHTYKVKNGQIKTIANTPIFPHVNNHIQSGEELNFKGGFVCFLKGSYLVFFIKWHNQSKIACNYSPPLDNWCKIWYINKVPFAACARSSGDRAVVSGTASCGGSNPSERAIWILFWKNLLLITNRKTCYSITCSGQAPLSHIINPPSVGTLGFYFVYFRKNLWISDSSYSPLQALRFSRAVRKPPRQSQGH